MATVKPLHEINPPRNGEVALAKRVTEGAARPAPRTKASPLHPRSAGPPPRSGEDNLNSHWDRRIKRGGLVPDISIDLHDANLSRAYARLDGALEQAIAQKLKVLLLVTGKVRAHDRASGEGRGAIVLLARVETIPAEARPEEKALRQLCQSIDAARSEYVRRVFGADWLDVTRYDLAINTGRLGVDGTADLIERAVRTATAAEAGEGGR